MPPSPLSRQPYWRPPKNLWLQWKLSPLISALAINSARHNHNSQTPHPHKSLDWSFHEPPNSLSPYRYHNGKYWYFCTKCGRSGCWVCMHSDEIHQDYQDFCRDHEGVPRPFGCTHDLNAAPLSCHYHDPSDELSAPYHQLPYPKAGCPSLTPSKCLSMMSIACLLTQTLNQPVSTWPLATSAGPFPCAQVKPCSMQSPSATTYNSVLPFWKRFYLYILYCVLRPHYYISFRQHWSTYSILICTLKCALTAFLASKATVPTIIYHQKRRTTWEKALPGTSQHLSPSPLKTTVLQTPRFCLLKKMGVTRDPNSIHPSAVI